MSKVQRKFLLNLVAVIASTCFMGWAAAQDQSGTSIGESVISRGVRNGTFSLLGSDASVSGNSPANAASIVSSSPNFAAGSGFSLFPDPSRTGGYGASDFSLNLSPLRGHSEDVFNANRDFFSPLESGVPSPLQLRPFRYRRFYLNPDGTVDCDALEREMRVFAKDGRSGGPEKSLELRWWEQKTGHSPPGSASWDNHEKQFLDQQRGLQNRMRDYLKYCPDYTLPNEIEFWATVRPPTEEEHVPPEKGIQASYPELILLPFGLSIRAALVATEAEGIAATVGTVAGGVLGASDLAASPTTVPVAVPEPTPTSDPYGLPRLP